VEQDTGTVSVRFQGDVHLNEKVGRNILGHRGPSSAPRVIGNAAASNVALAGPQCISARRRPA
jgi:hypothetical protein